MCMRMRKYKAISSSEVCKHSSAKEVRYINTSSRGISAKTISYIHIC